MWYYVGMLSGAMQGSDCLSVAGTYVFEVEHKSKAETEVRRLDGWTRLAMSSVSYLREPECIGELTMLIRSEPPVLATTEVQHSTTWAACRSGRTRIQV